MAVTGELDATVSVIIIITQSITVIIIIIVIVIINVSRHGSEAVSRQWQLVLSARGKPLL